MKEAMASASDVSVDASASRTFTTGVALITMPF
jgi:hypothetical protein